MGNSIANNVKSKINRKVIIGIVMMFLGVAFIFVSSWFPFIVDPSKWNSKQFLTDEMITGAIVVFGMISVMTIAIASNGNDARSDIARARAKFSTSILSITDRTRFNQWIRNVLQPNDIQAIKKRELRQIGIEDTTVLDLEIDEIKALTSPQHYTLVDGTEKYYKSLDQKQIKYILRLRARGVNVKFVDPSYYLSVKNISSDRTPSEQSGSEDTKKAGLISLSITGRVVWALLVGAVTAMLILDVSEGAGGAEATYRFLQRMMTLATSSFMGYTLGCQINDIDAYYISLRVAVQNEYLTDTNFKGKTEQEIAKEEYEAIMAERGSDGSEEQS